MKENRTYLCVDLKSYCVSVECVKRGLDPLTTKLVVADEIRTDKIIFATSPIYDVEEVLGVASAKTRTTREIAKCYSIRVKDRETCLYEDGGRWFVEMKDL